MKIRPETPRQSSEDASPDRLEKAKQAFGGIGEQLSIRKEDPLWLLLLKILGQIALVFLMILLSPLLLVALVLIFLAAL